MSINIVHNHYYLPGCSVQQGEELLSQILANTKELQVKIAELKASYEAIGAKVEKIGDETRGLITKVQELTTAIEGMENVPEDVIAAKTAVEEKLQIVDDLVQDL